MKTYTGKSKNHPALYWKRYNITAWLVVLGPVVAFVALWAVRS